MNKKQNLTICCLQEIHFTFRDPHRPTVKRWKNMFHANGNQKRAGVVTFISDKIEIKTNNGIRDRKGHYI